MSRQPSRYIQSPVPMRVPRSYILADENGEYSEGEAEAINAYEWHERQVAEQAEIGEELPDNLLNGINSNLTELYHRKPDESYIVSQEMMIANDASRYYYRPAALARIPQRRLPVAAVPPQQPVHANMMQPPAIYYLPPHEEPKSCEMQPDYNRLMYQRSSPHTNISRNQGIVRRASQLATKPPDGNVIRAVPTIPKPAVTVRTPRYYRRSNIYKRPSTLCIPLSVEPEPTALGSSRSSKARHTSAAPGLAIIDEENNLIKQSKHKNLSSKIRIAANHYLGEKNNIKLNSPPRSAPPTMNAKMHQLLMNVDLTNIEDYYFNRNELEKNYCVDDIQNELEARTSELDNLLAQYQHAFSGDSDPKSQTSRSFAGTSGTSNIRSRRSSSKLQVGQILRPRLPPSLKSLQKRRSSKVSVKKSKTNHDQYDDNNGRIEIEQMTAEVLDSLLRDLSVSGITEKKTESQNESNNTFNFAQDSNMSSQKDLIMRESTPEASREVSKNCSQTTDDSTNNLLDSASEITVVARDHDKLQSKSSIHTSVDQKKSNTNESSSNLKPTSSSASSKEQKSINDDLAENSTMKNEIKKGFPVQNNAGKHFDDIAALELHKSKSYIVNLIDRALSRELGTIPEERPSRELLDSEVRVSAEPILSSINKNFEADLSFDLGHALVDQFASGKMSELGTTEGQAPCFSGSMPECSQKDFDAGKGDLLYTSGNDEPLYIKQLRKLRWGHLKHIQKEMRRLEDLERFLDSVSNNK